MSLLRLQEITKVFGGLVAVNDLTFSVEAGSVVGLIGPNGAGKTTVFNCISGFYKPTTGVITLAGESIAGLGSHSVAQRGVVRTFQNVRLFKSMTAVENL